MATKIQHLTRRRVNQLWRPYPDTGIIPIIGQQMDRPEKSTMGLPVYMVYLILKSGVKTDSISGPGRSLTCKLKINMP